MNRWLAAAAVFLAVPAAVRAEDAAATPPSAQEPAATGELTGQVLHGGTEQPIPGARLQIESSASSAGARIVPVDPSTGSFIVTLTPGDYKLRISADGFITGLYNVNVKEKRRARLTLKLNPVAAAAPVETAKSPEPGAEPVPADESPAAAAAPQVQPAAILYETLAADAGYNSAQLKIQPLKEVVLFGEGQTTLSPQASGILDRLATLIMRRERILRVIIRANSDEAANPELSRRNASRRAVSVKNYLVGRGIDPAKLTVDDKPLDPALGTRAVGFELIFVP